MCGLIHVLKAIKTEVCCQRFYNEPQTLSVNNHHEVSDFAIQTVLMYNRRLSDSDVASVEAWLTPQVACPAGKQFSAEFFGCIKWTKELRQCIIKNTGLPISFGLSANKTVSKIATGESKPNGELEIIRGYEKGFLSPLSINKIPMVGEKTSGLLKNMGIEKISTLQQMPIELLNNVLGENGIIIWKKDLGIF